MGLRDCISSALDRGAISEEEARWLAQKAKEYEGLDAGEAKRLFGEGLRAEEAERIRREGLQARAVDGVYSDVRRAARFSGLADVVRSAYGLFENFGDGFRSFRTMRSALLSQALTEMNDFMHTFRRDFALKRLNRPLLDDVARAAFGENVSDPAKALYAGWLKTAEKLRAMFNAAGGHIGELADWALPQSHDAAAMLNAGFEKWRDFIKPRLDWDRIKRPVTGFTVPEAHRDELLRQIFNSIVTDGWNRREPASTPFGKGALYNQRDDARFLHFKDADSWLDYSKAYGKGGPFAAMVDHVSGLTRDVALMQRFGPNPAATIEWLKQTIASEAAKHKLEEPSMFRGGDKLGVDFAVKRANYMVDGFYDAARGTGVPFSRTGAALGMFRDLQYGAKLGSAVIVHSFTNPVIQTMGRYLQGHSLVTLPMDLIRGFTRGQADEAGLILEDALHHLEQGAREQSAWMKAREVTRWLPTVTARASGLDAVANASRRAAFMGQMSTYGRLAGKAFEDLPARVRDGLAGFGVDAGLWDRIRAAKPYDEDSRAPLLRPQDIDDEQARLAYYGLLHGQAETLVPQSNMRVHAATAFASRAPLGNEIVKSLTQFKSGFMATLMLTQWHALERELTRNGAAGVGAYVATSVLALTIGGLLTLQLKNISAGKDALPMDPASEQGRATWGRAMLSGGALGIYGDFIASEMSSYGHNFLETLAGPTVTGAADLVDAGATATKRGWALATGGKPPSGGEEKDLVKALRNNTPVLSTHWALRAAFNRVILDQLSYLADPKAHQAMRAQENRIRRDTNQGMWWRPGELTPDRPPQFTSPAR